MNYYDEIAAGYDELHKEEQLAKLALIKERGILEEDDEILDVGCGTGFSLDYFTVAKAVGIDPSKELIAQYKGKQKVMVGVAESLPFAKDSFDVVISVTAIQNFSDVRKGLEEIKRVGKNMFVLTVLKRSLRMEDIEKTIREVFSDFDMERIEQDKDFLFFIMP